MELKDFHRLHAGQTCLVCGVGPNLTATHPSLFPFPSFGVNTIYKLDGWKPTYFVGVDERLKLDDGAAICEKLCDENRSDVASSAGHEREGATHVLRSPLGVVCVML